MTDMAPAVALLFDDVELGAQLRDALLERGAHIVHEGGIGSLSQQRLEEVAANVVVVNLDDAAADALDQFYTLIDGNRLRVVFNDAQATRGLAGWDRDRWARHLAVKVLQAGDLDPPRPADARELEVPTGDGQQSVQATAVGAVTAAAYAHADIDADHAAATDTDSSATPAQSLSAEESAPGATDAAQDHVQRINSESESLSAELEALLASAELSAGNAAGNAEDENLLSAADDDQDFPVFEFDAAVSAPSEDPEDTVAAQAPDFLLDVPSALKLSADEAVDLSAAEPERAVPVGAPLHWALLDDDAPASAVLPADPDNPESFGIEKLSAADFLAPDVDQVPNNFEPVMNLELVSIAEAVAPQAIHVATEMHLDELHMALSRLVVTGAAADGATAAAAFFAALPATSRLTIVHVQHLRGQSAAALVGQLATVCPLTVRLATNGGFTQPGEVLVAPPAQSVRVHRDGRVELRPASAETQEPSIDDNFMSVAEGFGRDALAIVFSGQGADGVAGAKGIRDRGGTVWVESVASGYADVVSDIAAEGPVDFTGTPAELAARLIEVFP